MSKTMGKLKEEQEEYYSILATGMDRVILAANDSDLIKIRTICFDVQNRTKPYREKIEKMAELLKKECNVKSDPAIPPALTGTEPFIYDGPRCTDKDCDCYREQYKDGCFLKPTHRDECPTWVAHIEGVKHAST